MFHMLTSFDLRPGVTIAEFSDAYFAFVEHMRGLGLVEGSGPIGRRQADSGLDTDKERAHQFFAMMHFRDHDQVANALDHIRPRKGGTEELHFAVISKALRPVFTAWQDI